MVEFRKYITDKDFEIANNNGISKQNLYNRVYNLGWSVDIAINKPIKQRGNKSNLYCCGISKLAKENGISTECLYNRIKRMGMSPHKAATKPVLTKMESLKKAHSANRKYSEYYIKKAKKNDITKAVFINRVKKGMDEETASTLSMNQKKGGNEYWRKGNKLIFKWRLLRNSE